MSHPSSIILLNPKEVVIYSNPQAFSWIKRKVKNRILFDPDIGLEVIIAISSSMTLARS
jgi:hypothetical protein|tara:strand:+ start:240 stop:416 length:177 start_codon:yes stop_codon:yes gene_type:complete